MNASKYPLGVDKLDESFQIALSRLTDLIFDIYFAHGMFATKSDPLF
jgi:hypothetical protein